MCWKEDTKSHIEICKVNGGLSFITQHYCKNKVLDESIGDGCTLRELSQNHEDLEKWDIYSITVLKLNNTFL